MGWTGESPRYRDGPWHTIEEGRRAEKPRPAEPAASGKPPQTGLPVRERWTTSATAAPRRPTGTSAFREATWDEALSLAAQELLRIQRRRTGPGALAALSSAKCTNEDNYLFMRMVRGAFGTNNVDHCTRLCHSTSVAAMSRALSTSAASGSMREIEEACDVIFIAGANTTETHPVFGALIKRAVARGAKLIVADVRRTELAALADIHLQMLPGTDVALYNAMLNHIIAARPGRPRVHRRARPGSSTKVQGRGGALHPRSWPPRSPASRRTSSGRRPSSTPRGPNTSTLWAMGLTQHATGTDIVASLLNLHARLRHDRPLGRGDAARSGARTTCRARATWARSRSPTPTTARSPTRPTGPSTREAWGVPEESLSLEDGLMVTEIVQAGSGVRGMYIMGENPVLSDPNIAHAEEWVRRLEFLAVQDLFLTETARWADVVLPGSSFAEKEGTFVNTERRIQLADAGRSPPPGEARRDLDILIDLTQPAGPRRPRSRRAEDVMREIAAVTPSWRGRDLRRAPPARTVAPVPGARRRTRRARRSSSPTASRPPTAGRSSCRSSSCRPTSCPTPSIPSCSTPAARCTTGTPAP